MDGALSFFSLGVGDVERGRAFYAGVFGWEIDPEPAVVHTPNVLGGIHGHDLGAAPLLFFAVDDMAAAIERVQGLGGRLDEADPDEDDESEIERFGRFRLCRDDQGSPFGLHQRPGERR